MEFKIMGTKGDAVYDYDLETAEIKFNELLSRGMLPFEITETGNKAMTVFKPSDKVVWLPRILGG